LDKPALEQWLHLNLEKWKQGLPASGVIIINPERGVVWQRVINSHFIEFMISRPLYLDEFVLGKIQHTHQTNKLLEFERQIVEEWGGWHTAGILLFQWMPGPDGVKVGVMHDLTNPGAWSSIKRAFHKFFMAQHKNQSKKSKKKASRYPFGRGVWKVEARYLYSGVDDSCARFVEKLTSPTGNQFSPTKKAARRIKNGHVALSRPLPSLAISVANLPAAGVPATDPKPRSTPMDRRRFCEYNLLKEIHNKALSPEHNLVPLRYGWEDIFTARCNRRPPCGSCRPCNIRIAQSAIVVFAAQGVADENILPHLGAVFRSARYQYFGVQQWYKAGTKEIATVLRHCSSQGLKACYIHQFLKLILDTPEGCPKTVESCACVYGMQKKSACLFLHSVFDAPVGIPVDRHLSAAFLNLNWVAPNCVDPTVMSHQVELWLPMNETAEINNVVAGLRQLYQKREYRAVIVELARQCGPEHISLLKKLTKDINLSQEDLASIGFATV
jgi:endonuclease III